MKVPGSLSAENKREMCTGCFPIFFLVQFLDSERGEERIIFLLLNVFRKKMNEISFAFIFILIKQ